MEFPPDNKTAGASAGYPAYMGRGLKKSRYRGTFAQGLTAARVTPRRPHSTGLALASDLTHCFRRTWAIGSTELKQFTS
jgi:hypothetical protein